MELLYNRKSCVNWHKINAHSLNWFAALDRSAIGSAHQLCCGCSVVVLQSVGIKWRRQPPSQCALEAAAGPLDSWYWLVILSSCLFPFFLRQILKGLLFGGNVYRILDSLLQAMVFLIYNKLQGRRRERLKERLEATPGNPLSEAIIGHCASFGPQDDDLLPIWCSITSKTAHYLLLLFKVYGDLK